jgi:21S rRNA (uridine2791-2'-O)-methyltransferase
LKRKNLFASSEEEAAGAINAQALEELEKGYIDLEKEESARVSEESRESDSSAERTVDVVLSDMCEPWEQTTGFWKRSLTDPYLRMMNTSGNNFRDHAGSMVCIPQRDYEMKQMLILSHPGPLQSGA